MIDLCANLSLRGHEIFAALRAENHWRQMLSFLPDESILNVPLRNSVDFSSALKIAKFVRENRVEIIHAHLARDYPVAALAARTAKAKLVLTRHLLFPLGFSHKFILPKDAMFIAVSESVRRQILKRKILPSERVRLIYNGVNIQPFGDAEKAANKDSLNARFGLRRNSPLVGIVGEIAAHKGQTEFVRAAAEVLKRFPETEFLIAGRDASPQKFHENDLRNLIEELGLRKKIHLLGWLENVAPVLSALDVFVSASHFESFGLATVEAMIQGCAVVAAETDGARETIENGKTGKLVPIGNALDLAAAIIDFLSDEKMRRDTGANARIAAAEKFGVEKMAAETENIYREIFV